MKRKTTLPMASPSQSGLGLPTIMDRELAAAHGAAYVHLAAFSIDIDRVYWLDPEDNSLPFAWEVFLTGYYLLGWLGTLESTSAAEELLEGLCAPLLEETPGEPPLGGQIVFAVYEAISRGVLPRELTAMFSGWKSPPRDLVSALQTLYDDADTHARQLAQYCLEAALDPPLSPPTRQALEDICSGKLRPKPFDAANTAHDS